MWLLCTFLTSALIAVSALVVDAPSPAVSKGGSTIQKYGAPPTTALDADDYEVIDPAEIEGFLRPLLGEYVRVQHELQSELVHLDVLYFPPRDDRPFWTLVTCGMSGRPMAVPEFVEGSADYAYAELVMSLPADWIPLKADGEFDFEFFQSDDRSWPVGQMMYLARFPHLQRTWVAVGHSITNDDPPRPVAPDTRMDGFVLGWPVNWPSRFHQMQRADGKLVSFLAVVPLYPEEMQFKLDAGSAALFERLLRAGVTELLRPQRESVAGSSVR